MSTLAPPRRVPLEDHQRFECKQHGWVVDALRGSTVWCRCGKKAKAAA
jgi:hypothetical protein